MRTSVAELEGMAPVGRPSRPSNWLKQPRDIGHHDGKEGRQYATEDREQIEPLPWLAVLSAACGTGRQGWT
jgi:hypothetical protein